MIHNLDDIRNVLCMSWENRKEKIMGRYFPLTLLLLLALLLASCTASALSVDTSRMAELNRIGVAPVLTLEKISVGDFDPSVFPSGSTRLGDPNLSIYSSLKGKVVSNVMATYSANLTESIDAALSVEIVPVDKYTDKFVYWSALNKAKKNNLVSPTQELQVDGMMWLERYYHIVIVPGLIRGSTDYHWYGMVTTSITILDTSGEDLLGATWVNYSPEVHWGKFPSPEQAVTDLTAALDIANSDLIKLLRETTAGHDIPGLGNDPPTMSNLWLYYLALLGRVGIVLLLGVSALLIATLGEGEGCLFSLILAGIALLLLFGLSWWKDAVDILVLIVNIFPG